MAREIDTRPKIMREIISAANNILNTASFHRLPGRDGDGWAPTALCLEQIEVEAYRILELIVRSGNPPSPEVNTK